MKTHAQSRHSQMRTPMQVASRLDRPVVQRRVVASSGPAGLSTAGVGEVLRSSGQPLPPSLRASIEPRFGCDFSRVRVHDDSRAAESARALSAQAYTVGPHVVFGANQFRPHERSGLNLVAHELAHVVQQSGATVPDARSQWAIDANPVLETEADRIASQVADGPARLTRNAAAGVQRKVEMRDVGRGEQSGFDRLGELVDRLNAVSRGLTFSMNGKELAYERKEGAELDDFDQQMMDFIDQEPILPLRLTNRHGLLGDRVNGFHDQVEGDAWASGYVDIDDLLASSDLGLKLVLVHFLRERSATRNYARRIGSESMDTSQPGPAREFDRVHGLGIDAEVQMLRDFFGDNTIRFIREPATGEVFRIYRNSRGDRIQARERRGRGARSGIDAISVEVVTRDGRTLTADEYKQLLEAERVAGQVERERLGGATEHREGGGSVPAP